MYKFDKKILSALNTVNNSLTLFLLAFPENLAVLETHLLYNDDR
jgi:hypothetical protein